MLAVLSARLGVGGRYRPYPPSIPVERRYFTLMFVRVSTVTVQDSVRQVRCDIVCIHIYVCVYIYVYIYVCVCTIPRTEGQIPTGVIKTETPKLNI